jgi:uncharacterized membrane protein YfcA
MEIDDHRPHLPGGQSTRSTATPKMSNLDPIWLVFAGFGGGLAGSIAGLASLASYPALLAIGLPPVTANVTNTVRWSSTAPGQSSALARSCRTVAGI